ncbi:MAG: hypothetical protein AAGF73_07115 [Actinomycetota bacterium]
MASGPPPFDEADAVDDPTGERRAASGGPNYLARRALAVFGAVAVIAVGAIVVGQFLGDDGGGASSSSGAVDTAWDTFVLIDERTDEIILLNDDGSELGRQNTDVRTPLEADVAGTSLVVRDDERAVVTDLTNNDEPVEFEFTSGTAPLVRPPGSANTLIASSGGAERLVLVHGPSGDILDTDEVGAVAGARFDTTQIRADPSGRNVLVTDAGNFQSVLWSFDRDEPSFFPGLALAIGSDVVVTTQNVGSDATISVFRSDGSQVTAALTPAVRAAMVTDDGVVLTSVDGEILALSFDADEAESAETMAIGTITTGNVSVLGDRLIVQGGDGVGIVDPSPAIVGQVAGAGVTTFGIDANAPHRGSCLIVERDPPGEIVLVELATGDIVAEALGTIPAVASADGCSAIITGDDGAQLVSADLVTDFSTDGEILALSPDGTVAVVEEDSRLTAVAVTNDGGDDIDLGRAGRTVRFIER